MGWMLDMVTSLSLGSSFSRAHEEVKDEEPVSESHREEKESPAVNGLSLYLQQDKTLFITIFTFMYLGDTLFKVTYILSTFKPITFHDTRTLIRFLNRYLPPPPLLLHIS